MPQPDSEGQDQLLVQEVAVVAQGQEPAEVLVQDQLPRMVAPVVAQGQELVVHQVAGEAVVQEPQDGET